MGPCPQLGLTFKQMGPFGGLIHRHVQQLLEFEARWVYNLGTVIHRQRFCDFGRCPGFGMVE